MAKTLPEILAEVKNFDAETKQLKHDLLKLCWSMRGSLTYEESMYLSVDEREIILKIIHENIEITKKTNLPYF